MFGTYERGDVEILLKDITGLIEPMETEAREQCIQNGIHYSEMLPVEYEPSEAYLELYNIALRKYSKKTADAIAEVSEQIWKSKGENVVLVSLARAGISIGVLIKKYIKHKYGVDVDHYAISIIRGRGIDKNAMKYILGRHRPCDIQFVDGWTGKGAIQTELKKAMEEYDNVSYGLAVLADPAGVASMYGTREDFLIASSCLNSTVSGLLSRTVFRKGLIGETEFHGAVYYKDLKNVDVTYQFIEEVSRNFTLTGERKKIANESGISSTNEILKICKDFEIRDINLVKPGIGETTRVLLRRVPWKILVHSINDEEHLGHIYQLAKEKKVKLEVYKMGNYRACGLIKEFGDS